MPAPEIPPVPPSIEQNVHEVRAWLQTPIGQTLAGTNVAEDLADSMARLCELDRRTLGEVLIRLSSHMAATIAVAETMPSWMLTNLVAMAGVTLIYEEDTRV